MLEPECNWIVSWIVSLPQLLSVCMQVDHVMGQACSASNGLGARCTKQTTLNPEP